MKWYFADVLEHLFITACALSGHARGCWLINSSPLQRLYWWTVNQRWDDRTAQHTVCPLCRFDRNDYVPDTQYEAKVKELEAEIDALEATAPTTSGGGFASFAYDAATGTMRRVI